MYLLLGFLATTFIIQGSAAGVAYIDTVAVEPQGSCT